MLDLHTLYLFITANILLALAPGPDNIYVLTQGITRGKKAAFITTLGFASGVIIHTSAAAFGITLIFQTSELAFDILKYIGAMYLIYLAYQAFIHRNEPLNLSASIDKDEFRRIYIKAFLMNILNPKVAIFFLAFLPQFVNPSLGSITFQMIVLGVIFMIVTIIVFGLIGYMGNKLSRKLRENAKIVTYMNTLTSFVLLSLGLKLAFTQR